MRRWNCGRGIGICALALGLGILVAAIFPVGCLMFIVRHMLYAAMKGGRELKIIVWKAPAFLRGILKCIFCSKE